MRVQLERTRAVAPLEQGCLRIGTSGKSTTRANYIDRVPVDIVDATPVRQVSEKCPMCPTRVSDVGHLGPALGPSSHSAVVAGIVRRRMHALTCLRDARADLLADPLPLLGLSLGLLAAPLVTWGAWGSPSALALRLGVAATAVSVLLVGLARKTSGFPSATPLPPLPVVESIRAGLLASAAITVGLLLGGLPAVFLLARWLPWPWIVGVEGQGGVEALGEAWRRTGNCVGQSLIFVLLGGLMLLTGALGGGILAVPALALVLCGMGRVWRATRPTVSAGSADAHAARR